MRLEVASPDPSSGSEPHIRNVEIIPVPAGSNSQSSFSLFELCSEAIERLTRLISSGAGE